MSVTSGTSNKNRLKLGAGFVGGGPSPILNPRSKAISGYSGSPRYSADSMFSIYTGAKKALEEVDEEIEALFAESQGLIADSILVELDDEEV